MAGALTCQHSAAPLRPWSWAGYDACGNATTPADRCSPAGHAAPACRITQLLLPASCFAPPWGCHRGHRDGAARPSPWLGIPHNRP
jgi:hypothetical protein